MQSEARERDGSQFDFLPVFRWLSDSQKNSAGIIKFHLLIAGVLYGIFLVAAASTSALYIEDGIGILQNPPFFAHITVTFLSIPFVVLIVSRTRKAAEQFDEETQKSFKMSLATTKLGDVSYVFAGLVGLFALAWSIVMATSFQIDIYDSDERPITFAIYTIIRCYQFLVCYPTLIAVCTALPIAFFVTLQKSEIGYKPFEIDGSGGLKKYLRVFDAPIFAVQCLAVLIAIANYIGWGGFTNVSTTLALTTPLAITVLAFVLYLTFARLVKSQRSIELERLSLKQHELYEQLLSYERKKSQSATDIADELQASLKVSELVRSKTNLGWIKYLVNACIAVLPSLINKEILFKFLNDFVA